MHTPSSIPVFSMHDITASMPVPIRARYQRGFTLTELAVVLVIVALLIGGMLIPLGAQTDLRSYTDAQKLTSDGRDALIGYALSHLATDNKPYLPCPDKTTAAGAGTANDGMEDREATGACTAQEGNLPWATLGVGALDPWNNRLRYAVHASFSNSTTGFDLTTLGSAANLFRVCTTAACAGSFLANDLPAVILSHGKNGFGAISSTGAANTAPTLAEELENTDGDRDFYSQGFQEPNGFDDVVTWLPAALLYNRLVTAGKLP